MVYTPPSFGQPGVSVSYEPKGLRGGVGALVTVTVPPASIEQIFAHRQWRAGMLMSDALLCGAFATAQCHVLELGAGTGLPSITACQVGAARTVVCSDYDEPELVRALTANVRANTLPQSCKVVGHVWGTNADELLEALPGGARFDVVLLADCLWDPLSHAALLKTVLATLAFTPAARVHVIAGLHTGRDKITAFVRRAYRAGLTLAPVSAPDLWPPGTGSGAYDDEPFAHAGERILELQVCGTATASGANPDPPRLTGLRRPFLLDGHPGDDDVHNRNRWLTVWSLMRTC